MQTLAERLPDQAQAMADVGYHFANLWLAAEKQNFPPWLGNQREVIRRGRDICGCPPPRL
jgi:hypothetical protein